MCIVDPALVSAIEPLVGGQSAIMQRCGISWNSWIKIVGGLPVTLAVAERLRVNVLRRLVVAADAPLGPMMQSMKDACGKQLEDIRLFDVFRGVQVGPGKKSAAFTLSLRAMDHTLTEDEINALVAKALKAAEKEYGAILR